ncbi:hypothetical protein JZ751_002033 [Albula glossodonta]|uniref:AP complex mu/sigma subunit domain-containing protein n=1 Tax=Albula glossodonta TaxID=121402 RepID=A0A8T2PFN9_9TELE|nr:hypothetical protein JZ751_002033 [Albula glossodonta]
MGGAVQWFIVWRKNSSAFCPRKSDYALLQVIGPMHFLLLFSRQGKLRLQKWYTPISEREKKKIIRDMTAMVLPRTVRACNFLHWRDLKIVYKRYASLYFCCGLEDQDNELLALEVLHRYVELLDKYFGNFLMTGEVQETSKSSVAKSMEESDMLQELFVILVSSKFLWFLLVLDRGKPQQGAEPFHFLLIVWAGLLMTGLVTPLP